MNFAAINLMTSNPRHLAAFLARHPTLAHPTRTTLQWYVAGRRSTVPLKMEGHFDPADAFELRHVHIRAQGRAVQSVPEKILWRVQDTEVSCTILLAAVPASQPLP